MTWKVHHRRGEVLRDVARVADRRRDGRLPMDVPGVRETFGDELTLLGALQLRWHTRLSGRIERELAEQPLDLEGAVVRAWVATAREMPGVRAVIDRATEAPPTPETAAALARARSKERELLALMSGRASGAGAATDRVGAAIEDRARRTWIGSPPPGQERAPAQALVDRIRAVLAA